MKMAAITLACVLRGPLPDQACTPGSVAPVSIEHLCDHSYGKTRHVTMALKAAVLREYGMRPGNLEIDHLIPRCLGGADVITNLWPQPAEPRPGFHEKDRLEADICREVCAGKADLDEMREAIRKDWLSLYLSRGGK